MPAARSKLIGMLAANISSFLAPLLRWIQLLQHLKNEAGGPVSHGAAQGQGHSGCLQNFLTSCAQCSSTADVVLDSAMARVADTDSERDQLLLLLRKCSILEGVGFHLLQLSEGADAAAPHGKAILFPVQPDLTDIFKHSIPFMAFSWASSSPFDHSPRLRQQLLSPDQAIPDIDAVAASNRARGTIAATHGANFFRHALEVIASLVEAAAKIVVSQKT